MVDKKDLKIGGKYVLQRKYGYNNISNRWPCTIVELGAGSYYGDEIDAIVKLDIPGGNTRFPVSVKELSTFQEPNDILKELL